jgi:hypothetical protein
MLPSGVVTIKSAHARFMVTTGFIRVRRRKLKPKYRWSKGKDKWGCHYKIWDKTAPTSLSYDLVRAVRINGQPRHKFVLGFGSPVGSRWGQSPIEFWMRVLRRTKGHGFTKAQQSQIIEQLKRKGIPLPTLAECKKRKAQSLEIQKANPGWPCSPERYDAVIAFVRRKPLKQ